MFQNLAENLTEQYPSMREANPNPANVNTEKLSAGSKILSIEIMDNRNAPIKTPRKKRIILFVSMRIGFSSLQK